MPFSKQPNVFLLIGWLTACGLARGAADNPLPNAGFEDGDAHWQIADTASKVIPEAAHAGKMGLRAGDTAYLPSGSSIHSSRFPVKPGQKIALGFWARTTAANAGVYLWFSDARGQLADRPPACSLKDGKGQWQRYDFETTAPDRAAHVDIWVHTYGGSSGYVDVDDFTLGGIQPGVAAIDPPPARAQRAAGPAPAPQDIPRRKTPAVIILKFDDVKQIRGDVHASWKKLADYLESRKIKGGFGVICQTLEEATPQYVEWIRKRREAGFIEFWFHGYDHGVYEAGGTKYNEFNRRSYEELKKRVADSQALANEKLGFYFETFGPPGGVGNGSFDATTLRVMAEDPHIHTMLYPQPFDAVGKQFDSEGKLTILDRVWQVNLEGAVGVPDFKRFLTGYAQQASREYFVLQGHPAMWNDERFAEFGRIIDFLVERNAVFMTPTEYAAQRKKP